MKAGGCQEKTRNSGKGIDIHGDRDGGTAL